MPISNSEQMNILVTGAGGFIGSHLVEALLQGGNKVQALVRYNSQNSWGNLQDISLDLHDNLTVCFGDITDPYLVRSLVRNCDMVFHLAALIGIPYSYQAPSSYLSTNVAGTLNILEACRQEGIKKLIVTSTSEVYGTAIYTPIDENHPLQGQSPYSASKIAADKFAESYFCSFGLPVTVLRPFNTYGSRQSARAIIPTILSQAIAGCKHIKLGNLTPKRDLTFVTDTVKAFLLASQTVGVEGQTIHFGQGNAFSMAEIASMCLRIVGSDAEIISDVDRIRPEKSEVKLLLCNPLKAKDILKWEPAVSLEEGLTIAAKYIAANMDKYHITQYAV
jgi:NAD dependent epimerase/dehydratase